MITREQIAKAIENWREESYRNAKKILEQFKYCEFKGTKRGTIAKISNKIYDLNLGEDKGEERANTNANNWANIKSTKKEEYISQKRDFKKEKGEVFEKEKIQNGRSDGRLTKNILKNKEYNNNNYNYNNKYIGSKIKKIFPEYNKILTNF